MIFSFKKIFLDFKILIFQSQRIKTKQEWTHEKSDIDSDDRFATMRFEIIANYKKKLKNSGKKNNTLLVQDKKKKK